MSCRLKKKTKRKMSLLEAGRRLEKEREKEKEGVQGWLERSS